MVSQKVKIQLKYGLHARPAGTLAKLAQQYPCDVKMQLNEKIFNIKSIMGVISAGVKCGTEVELICNGTDERKALHELIGAIQSGLGE
ncbi:HPr family phosphocarrier protein [Caproiciproducens faecalis]|uniref:HPr family phosphocarrier protein n=1 Tax=Caproiciproducens faecalis TaxID=2820301 RepID=A0ABS7DKY0_9FIRM|nr:HPr family phosphocarrier protein [Caproiciproducens faecalis]MBW7571490.1 HPr family phosphocarrier protein [Caproiciproducens faecalis]